MYPIEQPSILMFDDFKDCNSTLLDNICYYLEELLIDIN